MNKNLLGSLIPAMIFAGLDKTGHMLINNTSEPEAIKASIKLFKTEQLLINQKVRTVTVALVIDSTGDIRAGYSVLNEGDEFNKDLGKTISLGRAMNDKTNLFKDKKYVLSVPLEKDYGRLILKHLADVVLRDIQDGKYQIKGIK